MPIIMNSLDKEQTVRVGGNDFTFKPRQLKFFHSQNIARALARMRAEDGIVELPTELEHLAHLKEEHFESVVTAEEKEIIEKHRLQGVESYCRKLRELHRNATVSLQMDIDKTGAKYDARIHATDADLQRLEELAKYQKSKNDGEQRRLDRMKELEKQVAPAIKG